MVTINNKEPGNRHACIPRADLQVVDATLPGMKLLMCLRRTPKVLHVGGFSKCYGIWSE